MTFVKQKSSNIPPKKGWTFKQAKEIYNMPFMDLLYEAHSVHRENHDPNKMQSSTLLNIKTGGCPENCSYCPQSAFYETGLEKEPLMAKEEVLKLAKKVKESGSERFCLGAAWRSPKDDDLEKVCEMVSEIKKMGLETCVTLGLLKDGQAEKLKNAGLDFYNHNIDTSEEFYDKIITTRKFQDRIDTISKVAESGVKVCCGGILGMGETDDDRIGMILTLANMPQPPESVPINKLIQIPGTPLEGQEDIDMITFVRTVALVRILLPKAYIRLSAGRASMSEEAQTLCFFAGVNSVFYGDKLLITKNLEPNRDDKLFLKLNMKFGNKRHEISA